MNDETRKCDDNESRAVEIVLQVAAGRLAEEIGVSELNASTMLADCALSELSGHAPSTTPEYLRALADKLENKARGETGGEAESRRIASIEAVSAEVMKSARGVVH